jgi:transcriptional regulator with XRE-family HTH domain
MHVGEKIETERLKRGWNQGALADAVGAKQPMISSWENSKTLPEPKFVPKIAEVLGIDIQWLVEQIVKERKDKAAEEASKTKDRSYLHSLVDRLPETGIPIQILRLEGVLDENKSSEGDDPAKTR